MFVYTAFGLLFSFIAASMVKYTGEKVRVRKEPGHVTFSKSSSMVSVLSDNKQHNRVEPPQYDTRTAYYSAGSGIPEVKVILGGFVIKGFLGIKTLIVKSVGMIMDPFGTGKIVLFQVSYDKDYHLFELVPLVICAALAGLFGTLVTHFNIRYQHLRKATFIGRHPITEVLCIMVLTSLVCYWNPFARMSLTEFAAHLFSECSPTNDNGGLCARTIAEIPQLLYLLVTTLVIKMCLTTITMSQQHIRRHGHLQLVHMILKHVVNV
ncbi:Putative Voltage-gated chloride channel [Rhizopus microsporus]|nr:Putative Voltage-gated chloride channel [Rhizopus microsporus]